VHAIVARSTFPSQKTRDARTTFGSSDIEKVHTIVARSTLPSQMVKEPYVRTAFGGLDVEKVHAVAARNTLPSKHGKTTTRLDHFWTLKRHFVWRKGFCTLSKMQRKLVGLAAGSEKDGKRGAFEEVLQRSAKMLFA
jgi:hypothetical protein